MGKSRVSALSEIDRVLSGIDTELRAAQDVRLREKVDRLMESAAQGADDTHCFEGWQPDGMGFYEWSKSCRWTKDGHHSRVCHRGKCIPSESCAAAYPFGGYIGLNSYSYLDEVPATYCNVEIFRDGVDGVFPQQVLEDLDWPTYTVGRTYAVDLSVEFVVVDDLSSAWSERIRRHVEQHTNP